MSRAGLLAAWGLLFAAGSAEGVQTHLHPADEEDAWIRLETSPRHAEWVGVQVEGGNEVSTWVVYPERAEPAPVVLLIHESLGLNEWVQNVADQLADHGYVAVVPDLLSGRGPGGVGSTDLGLEEATRLIGQLSWADVRRRLDAVAAWATGLPAAGDRLAIMGFCWGGRQAFRYATERPDLDAAVVFYGEAPDTTAVARIRSPVLGLYGGADARVTETAKPVVEWLEKREQMHPDSVPWHFQHVVYPGAGHGFLRQQSGRGGANLQATRGAWREAVAFLSRWLGA